MELTRNVFNKQQYDHMSVEDSKLYDEVKDSDDPKDKQLKRLLEDKARASMAAHAQCRY